eukprot:7518880-Lingulodinium_polyedra.AAC.1
MRRTSLHTKSMPRLSAVREALQDVRLDYADGIAEPAGRRRGIGTSSRRAVWSMPSRRRPA